MMTMLESPTNPAQLDSSAWAAARSPRVLLASRSPRRRTLLSEFGIAHDAEHPGFEDALLLPGLATPRQWVASLAFLKAWTKAMSLAGSEAGTNAGPRPRAPTDRWVVVGADTTCVREGRIVGTPTGEAEASEMLRSLASGQHEVLTGVALVRVSSDAPPERHIFVDAATVRVGELSDVVIDEYVESGAWRGKAGGYNLAERLGAGWPLEYVGDPTTIMGLPMRELVPRLIRMGVVTTFAKAGG